MKDLKVIFGKKWEKHHISYSFSDGIYGKYLIASTEIWICTISFVDDENESLLELKSRFPDCEIIEEKWETHEEVIEILHWKKNTKSLVLYLIGTDFQIQVWQQLLEIPYWKSSSYAEIAKNIWRPRAVRAVGTAIGTNPIAIIIPCHRVFRSDGWIGGYRWWIEKKNMINNYEQINREL
jgi:AraC family transcriptional regulator of adaptative response/methylated-DNA-[protein]-cysteine methyltransferase